MYFKLMGKLSARRKAILEEEKEQGFTLIELLVVVVIIGILAAIAIPIYIGVQNGAKDAAVKSDLTNAKTAVVAYFAQNGDSPATPIAADGSNLADYGYATSSGVTGTAFAVTNSADFCVEATSSSTGTPTFHITASTTVASGGCTAATP